MACEMVTHTTDSLGSSHRSEEPSPGREVLIVACGRTVTWKPDSDEGYSVKDLQQSLQSSLEMQDTTFHIYTITGNPLETDMELRDAVENGHTPLLATLIDASAAIEEEGKKDEAEKMQFKLVKDQMAAVLGKLATCSRQISDFQLQMQDRGTEFMNPAPDAKMLENDLAHDVNRQGMKLEFGLEHIDKRFQDLHTMYDKEVIARQSDSEEIRTQIEQERQERAALQNRYDKSMHDLRGNLEVVFRQQVQIIVDKVGSLQDSTETAQSLEQLARQSANARLVELERRCSSLETRLMENVKLHSSSFADLHLKHNKTSEDLRLLEQNRDTCNLKDILERVSHLENALMSTGPGSQEIELSRFSQGLTEEQAQQLADIQKKLTECHNEDAAEGDVNVREGTEVLKSFNPQVVSEIVQEMIVEMDKANAAFLEEAEIAQSTAAIDSDLDKRSVAVLEDAGISRSTAAICPDPGYVVQTSPSQMSTHLSSAMGSSPASSTTNISPNPHQLAQGSSTVAASNQAIVASTLCSSNSADSDVLRRKESSTSLRADNDRVIVATQMEPLTSSRASLGIDIRIRGDGTQVLAGSVRCPSNPLDSAPVQIDSLLQSSRESIATNSPDRLHEPTSPSTLMESDMAQIDAGARRGAATSHHLESTQIIVATTTNLVEGGNRGVSPSVRVNVRSRGPTPAQSSAGSTMCVSNSADSATINRVHETAALRSRGAVMRQSPERAHALTATAISASPADSVRVLTDEMAWSQGRLQPHKVHRFVVGAGVVQQTGGTVHHLEGKLRGQGPPRSQSPTVRVLSASPANAAVLLQRMTHENKDRSGSPRPRGAAASSRQRPRSTSLTAPTAPPKCDARQSMSYTPNAQQSLSYVQAAATPHRRVKLPP